MRNSYFKTLLLVFMTTIVFANTFASNGIKGRYTKEKTIKKEYNVNADALLKITNSYGNLNITSWNENRIEITVVVTTDGNNEEQVLRKLDEIDVLFEASSQQVMAETKFKRESQSWWSSLTSSISNNNVNMEINYTVKMPITNSVDLNNDYGGIYLNKLKGRAAISCDYGHLEVGELLADNNMLRFDYTNNTTIGFMKSGKINADYSSFTIEKGGEIELSADYTKSTFNSLKSLRFTCDYGNLDIDQIGAIDGSGDYLSLRMGRVSGDVDLSADYGSIKISELTADAGNVNINTDYANIRLGYAQDYHFNFTISLEYAGLSGEEEFDMVTRRIESSNKYYKGNYGGANAENNITISSEYGGVTFEKK
ncbi:hypothetical protein [Flavimarina sp. Hel_I_48]|uniref:hypothetical protein n=1 Tax=Flavimarina sp. Hel_I_48 TaxID=1392488 RepID=UPI0004DEE459|nr:hypothetical protein [Flavimarina sp. Hel_I_48]